ncbi:myogenesis-regulating glycosidase-like isoform X4 [Tachypleus tridentatus]
MEMNCNPSTEDLVSLESGIHSAEANQATVNSIRSLDADVTVSADTTPGESPTETPTADRKPASLQLSVEDNTWKGSQKSSKISSGGQLRKNIQNRAARVKAVFHQSKPSDLKFRLILVLLFCCIVALVTFTWFLYHQKLMNLEIGDKIRFHEVQRILHLLRENGEEHLTGYLGLNMPVNLNPYNCQVLQRGLDPNICVEWKYRARLMIGYWHKGNLSCYSVNWQALSHHTHLEDCFSLHGAFWYGMGEIKNISWPLSNISLNMQPFVSGDVYDSDFGSILERYWLSSEGIAIHVDPEVPLYVSLNSSRNERLCFIAKYQGFPYHVSENKLPNLKYTLCTGTDIKSVHLDTMHKFHSLPSNISSSEFLGSPVWATGPKFGTSLSQESLQVYANHIMEHGFEAGNILIDIRWQEKEGDLQFRVDNFTNPEEVLNILHHKGFKVLLAVHPYVCVDSVAFLNGTDGKYFITDEKWNVPLLTRWQDSVCAIVDVTNKTSAQWFLARLKELKSKYNIDGFVFLGGQSLYLPKFYNFQQLNINPDTYLTQYLQIASKAGNFMGTGVGFNTQNIAAFVAIAPRTSTWDATTGLRSILPTVLSLELLGYPVVNPGSVGGDVLLRENATLPDKELYLRWLQLAAFMPVVQFSVPPGDYDLDVIKAAKVLFKIREERVLPVMQHSIQEYLETGAPIIRPLWWLEPNKRDVHVLNTQFVIGEEIIVAPILDKGKRNRDIYLPQGWWRDELLGQIQRGGKWLHNYTVPLDKVAYFTRTEKPT